MFDRTAVALHRRRPLIATAVAAAALVAAAPAPAQTNPAPPDPPASRPAPTIRQAQQLIQQQDFAGAEAILETIVSRQPASAPGWFFLGYARHAQGKLDEALPAHLTAAEIGQGRTRLLAMYNVACVHSLKDNADRAFAWLDRAVEAGYRNAPQVEQDVDFDNVRDDPRYEKLLARMSSPPGASDGMPRPVAVEQDQDEDDEGEAADADLVVMAATGDWTDRPARRRFDFWLGTWDAINADGRKVGTNVITLRENDMILHESWTSANGGTGQSINYYDPAAKKWRQNWVSMDGGVVRYEGNFTDGAMRYEGKHITADGTVTLAVCTLTPKADGRIHHVIKHTADEGETWQTYFDAHYVRQGGGE